MCTCTPKKRRSVCVGRVLKTKTAEVARQTEQPAGALQHPTDSTTLPNEQHAALRPPHHHQQQPPPPPPPTTMCDHVHILQHAGQVLCMRWSKADPAHGAFRIEPPATAHPGVRAKQVPCNSFTQTAFCWFLRGSSFRAGALQSPSHMRQQARRLHDALAAGRR